MAVKLSNCSLMEMLAVIPKVHFKKSQNFRIKGSWMEGFIHIEPRSLGGNARTFAGVPALNLAPLPPQSPSFFQPWWNRTERGSCDKLSAQLGDGATLMRGDRCGTAWYLRVQGDSQPQQTPAEGAQCWDLKSRLLPSLVKIITPDCSQGVAEGGSFSGSGSLCNCFPNVWGLALQYVHA